MHDGVFGIQLDQYEQFEASEYVLLLKFECLLNIRHLLLVKNQLIEVVPVDCPGPHAALPLQDLVEGLEETPLPDQLDVESVFHLLEVHGRVLHCYLNALLVRQVMIVHIL